MAQGLEGAEWSAAAAQAAALWRERGSQRDPLPLIPITARLEGLRARVGEQVAAALTVVEAVKNAPVGPKYRPRLIITNQLLTATADTNLADLASNAGPHRDWVSRARAGWDELDWAAAHVRSALGISPHAWGHAYVLLGPEEAITALAAIRARHAAGKVRSPRGAEGPSLRKRALAH